MSDPEPYWDAKARASTHDPLGAVAYGDPLRDRCIDRVQRRLLRLALARAMPPGRHGAAALDMGCGTGRFAPDLGALGLDYHGIDISSAMIEIARREHPAASSAPPCFAKFDGQSIPFPDARFALALSLAVIHHNTYPRQERLLDELVRVLAPGGSLILFEGIGRRTEADDGVFFYRPVTDWRSALEARGLTLEWQRGARYFALEHIGMTLASRLSLIRPGTGPGNALSRTLLRAGAHLDPYLISARPNRLHDRWFTVWRKSP